HNKPRHSFMPTNCFSMKLPRKNNVSIKGRSIPNWIRVVPEKDWFMPNFWKKYKFSSILYFLLGFRRAIQLKNLQ
ncbi:MAG: hypothetical protein WBP74_09825, partial [Nitrososphaeraceae archaeon]